MLKTNLLILLKKEKDNIDKKLLKEITRKGNVAYFYFKTNELEKIINENNKKIVSIDMSSQEYVIIKNNDKTVEINYPVTIELIKEFVKKIINDYNCKTIIFDSISYLLKHQDIVNVITLTNNLILESDAEKIFVVLKEYGLLKEKNESMLKNMSMFADKII